MSAATRLHVLAPPVAAFGAALLCLAGSSSVRQTLARYLTQSVSSWQRAAALVTLLAIAAANFKNLPGIWHIRVLRGILYHLYLQPVAQQPKHLFAPVITASRNTLYDTDYNFHKSNSTYFADLDVARAHLVACIVRTGLARLNCGDEAGLSEETKQAKGSYFVALGAVACFFHKQIEPFQAYEIHTRVLSWDRKWLYVVSHVVKKGAISPRSYTLQPWKKSSRKPLVQDTDLTKYIFATSIARYVFKKGRLTINPQVVLQRSKLLPARSPAVDKETASESTSEQVSTPADAKHHQGQVDDSTEPDWTWEDMEAERLRGLESAHHFEQLGSVRHELKTGDVLGSFGDYW